MSTILYLRLMRQVILLSLFLCSCGADLEQQVLQLPHTDRWLGDIAVYESFDDIAPLFTRDSDTTYIVNFWATWCKPCVEELPYFEQLQTRLEGLRAEIILVSLDFPKQLESKLVPFVDEHQLSSTIVALTDGKFNRWIDRISNEWSGAIPATYIYRADKNVFIEASFENLAQLEELVMPFII